ncbi:SRPBCC family protein [Streptomyces sp. NPDC085529]|uniref:SRPBCC family protein n=1 Tax=Streptomyces sp. NPDC085529 TaxID=3365729 RepID=UPI0037D8A73C
MPARRQHRMTHDVRVAAPASAVYALIADPLKWPCLLSPNVHVERLEPDGERERLRIWALMDDRVTSWISWRRLAPGQLRVEFGQERPAPLLHSMTGSWSVRSRGEHDTRLVLDHDFSVVDDRPDSVAWAERVTDRTSRIELAELKSIAERWTVLDELMFSFQESVRVEGPPELVYDFLYRVGDWPQLVPHVTRVDLVEESPGVQRTTVHTQGEAGAHTSRSVRICFPHAGRIVYKETPGRPLPRTHIGEWVVLPDETGVTVLAQHHVLLDEAGIAAVLGEGTSIAQARGHVRQTLRNESLALLALAKRHAEGAIRML